MGIPHILYNRITHGGEVVSLWRHSLIAAFTLMKIPNTHLSFRNICFMTYFLG
jgi:hypothetical protein